MGLTGLEPTAAREPKHMSIYHAIGQLRDTRDYLQKLINEVSGKDSEKKDTPKDAPGPSLLYALDHFGGGIAILSSGISDMVNELRELIL